MAEFAIQAGLYQALTLAGLTVHDVQPQAADGGSDAPYPCVTVGTVALAPWDTKDRTGFDFSARIHVYSRSGSLRETKDIQSLLYRTLHRGEIAVAGYALVDLLFETGTVLRETDGSFHGISTFRGLIETAS